LVVVDNEVLTDTDHHVGMEEHSVEDRLGVYCYLGLVYLVYPTIGQSIALVVQDGVVDVGANVVGIERNLEGVGIVDGVDVGWVESGWEDRHVFRCDE
jgi:hypothetical protein